MINTETRTAALDLLARDHLPTDGVELTESGPLILVSRSGIELARIDRATVDLHRPGSTCLTCGAPR